MSTDLIDATQANLTDAERTQAGLRVLVEAAQELNSSLELDEVFHKVAGRVRSLINYHLFCVMLWNEDSHLLEHSFSTRFGEHVEIGKKGGFPVGYGISGSAARQRRPVRVPDVLRDPRYVRFRHVEVEIRSELAVPLVVKDCLIGVLDLESMDDDAFSAEDERLLTALASHIAIALENARLYAALRRDEQRLEDDLDTAREMQKALLPRSAPAMPGLSIGVVYEPARQLGGDFYDFIAKGDGTLAFAVGDVAGKGTPAALYGSLAVGMMRGHVVQRARAPEAMLEHLNQQLCLPHIDDRFLAVAYGLYEPDARVLTLANGGFPQPFLVRGGVVERLPIGGLALGIVPDVTYEPRRLTLERGDVVALCSDGFEECRNARGETFGVPRLASVLSQLADDTAQQIADGLLCATREFSAGSGHLADDRTAVVLKVD